MEQIDFSWRITLKNTSVTVSKHSHVLDGGYVLSLRWKLFFFSFAFLLSINFNRKERIQTYTKFSVKVLRFSLFEYLKTVRRRGFFTNYNKFSEADIYGKKKQQKKL